MMPKKGFMVFMMDKLEFIMKFDPVYLSQEFTWKASLGVLSIDGNICIEILASYIMIVKEFKK